MAQVWADAHFGDGDIGFFQNLGFKVGRVQHLAEAMAQHFPNPQLALRGGLAGNVLFLRLIRKSFRLAIERASDFFDFVALNSIARLEVFVILKGHTAFLTRLNLFDFVFEAAQRR